MKTAKRHITDGQLVCSKCKEQKPIADFYRDKNNPTGYQYVCKKCADEIAADWRARNRERVATVRAEYGKLRYAKKRAAKPVIERPPFPTRQQGWAARKAVNQAIKRDDLPPVSTQYCVKCFGKAQHYHHTSYREDDLLNVIPMCASCHGFHHRRNYPISDGPLGIIATSVGIVRIAIADK